LQQTIDKLNGRISEMTSELASVAETKHQLELDLSSKCDALQNLSTEFEAAKASFEV